MRISRRVLASCRRPMNGAVLRDFVKDPTRKITLFIKINVFVYKAPGGFDYRREREISRRSRRAFPLLGSETLAALGIRSFWGLLARVVPRSRVAPAA